jgi:restriction endonuclease S subunit
MTLLNEQDIENVTLEMLQELDYQVVHGPAIVPDFGSEEILFTHHIYAVRNEKVPELFLYYLYQNNSYKERAITFATGTTVLALPKEAILEYEFVVPQEDIFNQFGEFAKDIFNRIILNTKSIESLQKTRDLLLPKLMTGKIRVKV